MQPVRRKPDFSRKAPSHLLGSSRSLCRAVWGAGCWYLTATAALCPALRRPWHVSQDTSAQHVTTSMSWQEQVTAEIWKCCSREVRECCVPTPAEEPGLVSGPWSSSAAAPALSAGTQNCWCQTPSEQLPVLQGCPSTARRCQSRRWL